MVTDEVLIEARGLSLAYRDGRREVRAVREVDLTVRRGEFVGLVGPSGSGKSSLLFLLAGLRKPDTGNVFLLGKALPGEPDRSADLRRRHIGFLFQEPFLLPWLSVRENALTHVAGEEAEARVEHLAAAIGMEDLLDERPHRLSGGERQRAGILRALAGDPDLVLADEPTANLDQATGRRVVTLLEAQCARTGLLVVTHDPAMLEGATRTLHLLDGFLRDPLALAPPRGGHRGKSI
ncbi:MAG: ABC transporter ATP-binding protein [Planctomycetota bacterium]